MNMTLGAIPVIGDLFSVWFKSNLQNAQLLHRHCRTTAPVTTLGDWLYVSGLVFGILILLGVIVGVIFWLGSLLLALGTSTPPQSTA
jgi:hypothetical protein